MCSILWPKFQYLAANLASQNAHPVDKNSYSFVDSGSIFANPVIRFEANLPNPMGRESYS